MNSREAARKALDELGASEVVMESVSSVNPEMRALCAAVRALGYAVLATVPDPPVTIQHEGGPGIACGFKWIDRENSALGHTCFQDHSSAKPGFETAFDPDRILHQCTCGAVKAWHR